MKLLDFIPSDKTPILLQVYGSDCIIHYISLVFGKDYITLDIENNKFSSSLEEKIPEYLKRFLKKYSKLYKKKIKCLMENEPFDSFVEFCIEYDLKNRKVRIYEDDDITDERYYINLKKLKIKAFKNFESKRKLKEMKI